MDGAEEAKLKLLESNEETTLALVDAAEARGDVAAAATAGGTMGLRDVFICLGCVVLGDGLVCCVCCCCCCSNVCSTLDLETLYTNCCCEF